MKNKLKGIKSSLLIAIIQFLSMTVLSSASLFLVSLFYNMLEGWIVTPIKKAGREDFSLIAKFYGRELIVAIISGIVLLIVLYGAYMLASLIVHKICKIYEQTSKRTKITVGIFQIIFAISFSIITMNFINTNLVAYYQEQLDNFNHQIDTYEETIDTMENNPFSSLFHYPDNYTLENLTKGKSLCEAGIVIARIFEGLVFIENILFVILVIRKIKGKTLADPVDENGNKIYIANEELKLYIIFGVCIAVLFVGFIVVRNKVDPFVIQGSSSQFRGSKFNRNDTCTSEEKILRAKEITEGVKVGEDKEDVENRLGKMRVSSLASIAMDEYYYSFCSHANEYTEDQYLIEFEHGKITLIYCAGITVSPKETAEILESKIDNIDKASRKIKKGMKFDKVKEILGNSYLLVRDSYNSNEITYMWLDITGDYVEVTFTNGKASQMLTFD